MWGNKASKLWRNEGGRNEGYIYLGIVELDKIKENEMKDKNNKGIKAKYSIGPKIKTKWGKQINSNKFIGQDCIQIRSRNATVEREWAERCW